MTLVAYGAMVPLAEQAADALADEARVEVLDIRTLKPLDEEALLASAGEDRPRRDRPGGAAHVRATPPSWRRSSPRRRSSTCAGRCCA